MGNIEEKREVESVGILEFGKGWSDKFGVYFKWDGYFLCKVDGLVKRKSKKFRLERRLMVVRVVVIFKMYKDYI